MRREQDSPPRPTTRIGIDGPQLVPVAIVAGVDVLNLLGGQLVHTDASLTIMVYTITATGARSARP